MRFNHAPTEGYENDVGRKTTVRVVNSQVSMSYWVKNKIGVGLLHTTYLMLQYGTVERVRE